MKMLISYTESKLDATRVTVTSSSIGDSLHPRAGPKTDDDNILQDLEVSKYFTSTGLKVCLLGIE